MKVGAVMKAVRQRRGLSQEELAARLNMNQSDISKFENDRKLPDLQTMMMWAEQTCAKEVIIAFLYGMDSVMVLQNLMTILGGYILWI